MSSQSLPHHTHAHHGHDHQNHEHRNHAHQSHAPDGHTDHGNTHHAPALALGEPQDRFSLIALSALQRLALFSPAIIALFLLAFWATRHG